MLERVGVLRSEHQPRSNRLPKVDVEIFFPGSESCHEERERGARTDTSKLAERCLRFLGQTIELGDHEIDHVVGIVLGLNATKITGPSRFRVIEDEQRFVRKIAEKLDSKKRVTACFVLQQLHQRTRQFNLPM